MNRYFRATCKEDGQADEDSIVEIYPPYGVSFWLGVLVGITVSIIAV